MVGGGIFAFGGGSAVLLPAPFAPSSPGLRRPYARERAGELLELVALADAGNKKIKSYSGGMKQRILTAAKSDPLQVYSDTAL